MASLPPPAPDGHSSRTDRGHPPIQEDGGIRILPVEGLSRDGIIAAAASRLRAETRLPAGWLETFDAAWSLYQERAAVLAARCPAEWFPPRCTNVCIATEPRRTRPYFQPIDGASWLLEASDFDPACANPELGAYLFLHAERLGLERDVVGAVLRNLSYWLDRSPEEIERFAEACQQSPRRDAAGWRALARIAPTLRAKGHHPAWHAHPPPQGALRVPGTALSVPPDAEDAIERFAREWQSAAEDVVARYAASFRGRPQDEIEALTSELRERPPRVLLTAGAENVLWDPDAPERVDRLRSALARAAGPEPVRDIRRDLARVAARTGDFIASLAPPGHVPDCRDLRLEPSGLVYLHPQRACMVYDLAESEGRRLREPSPPFERWLLGARVLHEWGHAATSAGWIGIGEGRAQDFRARAAELADLLDALVRDAPGAVREAAAGEIDALRASHGSAGAALLALLRARADDYCANLLVAALAPEPERLTYVRSNVRSLVGRSRSGVFSRLARYLHEMQYLRFADIEDPLGWLLDSTWARDEYLASGIVSEAQLARVARAAEALYDCFVLDPKRFRRMAEPGPSPGARISLPRSGHLR